MSATDGGTLGALAKLSAIGDVLAGQGLLCRGGFYPRPEDGVPAACLTLVVVGNAGPAMWEAFARQRRDEDHALDTWTRRVLTDAAGRLGAEALFPFDGPPHFPFLRWARRAEAVHPSPLGPLIHPEYGLWHAYRGALAFARTIDLGAPDRRPSPCEACPDKPCLTTCPAGAIGAAGYDEPACVRHLESAAGADCMDLACRARRACPVGRAYQYRPAQAGFHMEAFLRARQQAGAV